MRAIGTAMATDASDSVRCAVVYDIVVVGSSVGRHISPVNSVYGATKFAVNSLAEAMRRELAPKGIRVNVIEPGIVGTNFQETAGYNPEWFATYSEEIGSILTADNVAETIEFIVTRPPHVHLNNVMIRPTRQPYP